MQKRPAPKKAAVETVQWLELYNQLKALKFSERNLRGDAILIERAPSTKDLVRTMERLEYCYMRADNLLHCQLTTLAAMYFPVEASDARAVAFVNELCNIYAFFGINEMSGFARRVYALQPQRSQTPRWLWANVMAHLLFVASLPPALLEQREGYWLIICICARYTGPVFEHFLLMLLSVFMVTGMDPPRLPVILVKHYLDRFYISHKGVFEPKFYYQIKN